jgi:hypothetical protein
MHQGKSMANESKSQQLKSEFEQAGDLQQLSLIQEFGVFLLENKKWWLLPILLAIGLMALLVVLGSTGAAPFIYTLF